MPHLPRTVIVTPIAHVEGPDGAAVTWNDGYSRAEFSSPADAEAFAARVQSSPRDDSADKAEALAVAGLAVVAAWTRGNLGMAVTELANLLREHGYDVPN